MGGICLRSPSGGYLQIEKRDVVKVIKASRSPDKQTIDLPDWVSELGKLTEDQIKGLAKLDTLSKTIACGQALWLVTQVISRLIEHQAITLLEVSTCAYVLCALLSYVAWWKKPQNCSTPIIITCSDDTMSKLMRRHAIPYYHYEESVFRPYIWAGRHWGECFDIIAKLGGRSPYLSLVIIGLCPTLFGAIHVTSWNIELPSDVELWMWRASSIYCLIAGVIAVISVETVDTFVFGFVFFVFPPVYIIVRIFMIVEVFTSLRALPPSALESVQWSSFIPHV